jgi:hypothetical protein
LRGLHLLITRLSWRVDSRTAEGNRGANASAAKEFNNVSWLGAISDNLTGGAQSFSLYAVVRTLGFRDRFDCRLPASDN